jgi:cytochrome c oxidase subunit 3
VAQQREAVNLGFWIFLSTEVLLFGGLILCHLVMRILHPALAGEAVRQSDLMLGTVNTGLLLTSSLLVALLDHFRTDGKRRGRRRLLVGIILLGALFITIKGLEYHEKIGAGHVPTAAGTGPDVFYFLYFAMTGLHALHVLIGMGLFVAMLFERKADGVGRHHSEWQHLVGLYWHFVDIVWIFLFPLLYLTGR